MLGATLPLPHIRVTAVHGVERPVHGEPGRPRDLPRTAVMTTTTMLTAGFPRPIAEPTATEQA